MTLTMKTNHKNLPKQKVAMVRVGPLMSLPSILRASGCEPQPILDNFGFKPSWFENPDQKLPYIQTSRLIEYCVEVTACKHFGLLMGMRANPSSLGIAGFMLSTAPDVNIALQALIRHLVLHDQGGVVSVVTNGKFTSLFFAIHLSGVSASEQVYDLSISLACKIMRGLCGEDWNPTEVLLSRPPPQDQTPYRHFFKAPIRFNATESAIVFPSHWLQHKLPSADTFLFDFLERKATELHLNQGKNLIDQLRRFVRKSLITQECTANTAAQHLGIHQRTLNRRLQELGTSFRQVVNEVRYVMSQNFLANSEASNTEIALALGYTEVTTFSHSFKRWSGISPAQWREQQSSP